MENNNNTNNSNPTNIPNVTTPPATQPVTQVPVVQQQPTQQTPPAQKVPPAEKPPQKDPETGYEKLEERFRLAIDMRLQHYPHRTISKRLIAANFVASEGSVQHWFAKGGECYEVYEKMAEVRREELRKSIARRQELLDEGADKALIIMNKMLEKALDNEDITEQEYKAAQDILDRGGVPKQSKTDVSGRIEGEGVEAMASLLKMVMENKGQLPSTTTAQPAVQAEKKG